MGIQKGKKMCIRALKEHLPLTYDPSLLSRFLLIEFDKEGQVKKVLTYRETEILYLISEGFRASFIVLHGRIEQTTFQTHCYRIKKKLKARSMTHAVKLSLLRGELLMFDLNPNLKAALYKKFRIDSKRESDEESDG